MTCRSGADDSKNVIGGVFGDEINRVLNMFAEYNFSCRYMCRYAYVLLCFDEILAVMST